MNPSLSVAIDASHREFQHYKSGVYNQPDCTNMDHAVLLVGYGTENVNGKDIDYWLIKNSWGTSWGEYGYMKLERNNGNMCGVASHAVMVVSSSDIKGKFSYNF